MVTVLQNGLCIQSQMVPSYKRRCPNIFTIQLYLYTKVSALIYLLHNNLVTLKWQNYLPIDESERGGPVQNRRNHHQGEDRGQVAFGNDGAASDDDIVRASWWPIFFKKKTGGRQRSSSVSQWRRGFGWWYSPCELVTKKKQILERISQKWPCSVNIPVGLAQ